MITSFDAKLIAIFVFSLGSFIAGVLPGCLGLAKRVSQESERGERGDRPPSVILSVVLCFGGGVLFATAIVHLLPDTRKSLGEWSELIFCLGFFGMYLLDVIVHLLSPSHLTSSTSEEESLIGSTSSNSRDYGTTDNGSNNSESNQSILVKTRDNSSPVSCSNIGLLVAFSTHALLEGLVIGVQATPNAVYLLVSAVSCHKFLVAFCLGAELSADGRAVHAVLGPISVYVVGSAVGIGVGMLLDHPNMASLSGAVPVLEGLAGGTLLYVVVCEILPRERSHRSPTLLPILQLLALLVGFAVMVTLSIFVDTD